jgi:dTDP-4-amino-4,6-dideoxygalactose transaminase
MNEKPAILGGAVVRNAPFTPRVTMKAEESEATQRVLDSDILSAFIAAEGKFFKGGDEIRKFEEAWATQYGFDHAISVNSWTSGLVTAIGAIGIEPGDEVICSPYTMSASSTCALFYGGIPVFADIDPDTFCLSAETIEKCITHRTKAIVVVHLFGHPADMDGIMELAKRHDLRIIEDAAQAPGVQYKGQWVGAIGDIGGFSLNYHKHIHTGEGGMLVTNDEYLARRCQLIRNHGENAVDYTDESLVNAFGGNYRLTELQAAIGIEQLRRLEDELAHRQELAAHLRGRLDSVPGLRAQAEPLYGTHAYYFMPITYDANEVGLSRNLFVRSVLAELPAPDGSEGTAMVEAYVRPLYLSRMYQEQIAIGKKGFPFTCNPEVTYDYSKGICPVVERMYEQQLILSPLIRKPLDKQVIDDLADAVEKVVEHAALIRDTLGDRDSSKMFTALDAINSTKAR